MLSTFRFAGSSYLAAGSYDDETQELEIMFRSGAVEQHSDVPQGVVAGLQGAGSPGSYYRANIYGRYQSRRG